MNSFKDWLIKREKFAEIAFVGFLSLMAIIWHDHQRWIQALLDWCQVGMIAIVLCFLAHDERVYGQDRDQAGIAVAQFLRYWNCLWWLWLALYLVFAFRSTMEAIHEGAFPQIEWKTTNNFLANLANNFQSFFIFLLFLIMTKKTSDPRKSWIRFFSRLMWVFIVLIAAAELAFSILAPFTLRKADSATLSGEDLVDLSGFAKKLQAKSDFVSAYLATNLSSNTSSLLVAIENHSGSKEALNLRTNLVHDLNESFIKKRFTTKADLPACRCHLRRVKLCGDSIGYSL